MNFSNESFLMEEAHYKKSILHHGKIILTELDNEVKLDRFLSLFDMDTETLIAHEKILKSGKNNFRLIMAARDELQSRNLKWDYESETWNP